jgi:hypothetical protein
MQNNYYTQALYPLQDKVLRIIEQLPVSFYLTGNTALCRGYLNHRYSEELDFCLNADDNFQDQVNLIIDEFKFRSIDFELNLETQYLIEIWIKENEHLLNLNFINDIKYRVGVPSNNPLFKSTDNIDNILSNKVLLLNNIDSSNFIDIFYISLNYQFNWAEVLRNAEQKNIWIDNNVIYNILENFPIGRIDEINWINETPDLSVFSNYLEIMCKDILDINSNSLFQKAI